MRGASTECSTRDALTLKLPVRMGIATGEAELRGDDYFGPALNRAARVMAAGHGGQILVADGTQALVRDRLPDGATLRDLGEHRLRGVPRPERIFQLVVLGLLSDFPPLTTARHDNLPVQATSFIGPERELRDIAALLADPGIRLVTLTGPGGTGKTRLAIAAAEAARASFSDGAVFVSMAPLADASAVIPAIAHALDVRESGGRTLGQALADYVQRKHLLLVLDNLEHVLDAAPRIGALMSAPAVKLLATSRAPLHLTGERIMSIAPLAVPEEVQAADTKPLMECDAIRLFVERAGAVRPFALTERNGTHHRIRDPSTTNPVAVKWWIKLVSGRPP